MKFYNIFFLVLLTIILFPSCENADGGMFYSIIDEIEIKNGSLNDDISVLTMLKNDGTDGSDDYYFIASGRIFCSVASEDDPDWVHVSQVDKDDDTTVLTYSMICVDNYLYTVCIDTDGNYSLKKGDIKPSVMSSLSTESVENEDTKITYSIDFETINFDVDSDETVIDLYTCGDYVFLLTQNTTSGRVYSIYCASITDFSEDSDLTLLKSDINCAGELVVDQTPDAYWIAMGNNVYSTDCLSESTTVNYISEVKSAMDSVSDNDDTYFMNNGFSGILCADTDTATGTEIYLTSEEGILFKYVDSDDNGVQEWNVIVNDDDDDDDSMLFDSLKGVSKVTFSDENIDIVLFGCEEGYYEMESAQSISSKDIYSASEIDTELTTENHFIDIDISEQVVNGFFVDDENSRVFILGYSSGLWSNSKSDSERNWNLE